MKSSRLPAVAAISLSVTFAGVEASAQRAPKSAPSNGSCQAVWVTAPSFTGKPASRSRKSLNFSAAEVLDLEFQVVIPASGSLADRPLEVKLFTPKGHLYQALAVPAGVSVPQGTPKRRARYQTVTARLPVAGTTIVNNSLYGTWKAEAYFAGDRTACAKPRAFVINP